MTKILSMQDIMYIKLFSKITKINTKDFFEYGGTLFFCVPKRLTSKALGENTKNLRKMSKISGKRTKVVPKPKDERDIKSFIKKIVEPVNIRNIEIKEKEVVASATKPNKAALIGREKKKLKEMKKVILDFFGKDFVVV